MEGVFLKILNMSISAGWLVLAVWVLRLVLHKAPKALRVVLWGVVGLRLVWPFSIESILSLIPSRETVPADIGLAAAPAIQSGVPVVNSLVNPVLGSSMAATPQYSINPMQVALFIAAWVWVIGVAVMVVYALVSWLVIRLRVRESMREEKNIWLCDRVGSPFILGILRPRIYLPSDILAEDKPYVLAHEQAHLKRRDHWWKPLGFLLLALHWFNPLMWLAYILLCRDIELACDERVIRTLGAEGKKPYSEALINCSVPRHMIAACPVAFGETGVKGRIKSVLNYKKPAFWIILVAVVLCVAVAVCFLTDPKQEKQPEVLTQPPQLQVTDGNAVVKAWQGGYEWSYEQDGKTTHVIADADHPTAVVNKLPLLEAYPSTYSSKKGNTVSLTFSQKPDSISVVAHALNPTSSAGGSVEATTESFDLLEGEFIYVIDARWKDHGRAQYAFVGSFQLPVITDVDDDLWRLQSTHPQFFNLDTANGLYVYVWKMAAQGYYCGLGTNGNYTVGDYFGHSPEVFLRAAGLSFEQIHRILATYDIDREDVHVVVFQNMISSYYWQIDDTTQPTVEQQFWAAGMTHSSSADIVRIDQTS